MWLRHINGQKNVQKKNGVNPDRVIVRVVQTLHGSEARSSLLGTSTHELITGEERLVINEIGHLEKMFLYHKGTRKN